MDIHSAEQDFDLSFLEEIADGNKEFLIESIDMFLIQTPEIFENLSKAIASKDWISAAGFAHKVKSNLGFFGMERVKNEIQEIEINAKAGGNDPLLAEKFESVHQIVKRSLEQLQKIKKEKEAEL